MYAVTILQPPPPDPLAEFPWYHFDSDRHVSDSKLNSIGQVSWYHFDSDRHMSLNATKRPFGHMDIVVGNSKKVGKSCFIHFGSNTAFVCFEHWITKLTN